MTSHRRAWTLRAGVVVALATGAFVAVPAAPALAADVDVSPGSLTLAAGSDATVTVRITAKNPIENSANVSLTGLPNGVSCSSGCGQVNDLNVDEGKNHLLTLRASDGAPAANGTQVTVRVVTARDATTKNFSLAVTAKQPEEKKPVSQVSGRVRDADTGDGIEGALVALADSENHRCVTTTGSSGSYKFTSCDGKPIAAGELFLGTSHEDYEKITEKQVNANPGQSVTVATFSLKSKKASATPSATPSAAVTEEPATDDEVSPAATEPATQNTAAEAGGGMGSWLLIVLGGLLVALGVGAIVLLVIRRKSDNGDDDDDDPEGGAPGPRSPVPGAQGVYHGAPDATRVANRAGAAPDATMVARPSLADAPTMLQSPVRDDEFPDPYGAPMPARQPAQQQNDWAAPGGGYGAPTQVGAYGPGQQANGYGPEANGYGGPAQPAGAYGAAAPNGAPTAPGAYGRPTSGSGYGAPAGGPDGYGPTSGSGYGGAPNGPTAGDGYGPASPGGYGPQGGGAYGSPAAPGAPYGGAPSAGRPADDGYGGGYGAPQGGGYSPDPRGGDPRGADPRGGDRYDEPTGRWTGGAPGAGAGGYGAPQPPAGPPPAPYEDQRGYGGGAGYRPEPNSGGFQAAGGYGAPSDPYAGRPSAGNGYDDGGGYGQGDAGYSGGAGGYGAAPQSGGGYGAAPQAGGGYGAAPQAGGGYGAAPQAGGGYGADPQAGGGYGADPRGGYGGDPRGGGYERVPEQRGYDQQQGGYEQGGYYGDQGGGHPQQPGGGRHGDPQQPATRAERRPLDWLDD